MNIRSTKHADIPALQQVVEATGLFPAEMLPDMVGATLDDPEADGLWLTCDIDGRAVGLCYSVPEALADGAWNMLALAVLPDCQGQGCGAALVRHLEVTLRDRGGRIVIADTSGTDDFAPTRAFYAAIGYAEEARIRDFWGPGDDKVVYWKALG